MTSYDSITMPYLACVLVLMPVMGVRSYFRRKSGKPLPAKRQRYLSMIVTQIFLLTITAAVAGQNQIHLFGTKEFSPGFWVPGAAWLVLAATWLKSGCSRLSVERKASARLLLPESPVEMRYWIPISILAGISEEWAYPAVACNMLAKFARSPSLAVMVVHRCFWHRTHVSGLARSAADFGSGGILSSLGLAVAEFGFGDPHPRWL